MARRGTPPGSVVDVSITAGRLQLTLTADGPLTAAHLKAAQRQLARIRADLQAAADHRAQTTTERAE